MKAAFVHYAFSEILSRLISRDAAYGFGRFVARCVYALSPGERRAVEENLRVVLEEKTDAKKLRAKAGKVYENFSRYCVDVLYLGGPQAVRDGGGPASRVEILNLGALERALGRGHGVVAVSAHLGNWELAAAALARKYPVSVIARRHEDRRVERLFMERRARYGVRVIHAGFALRASLEVLSRNEIVGITGDREFSKTGGKAVLFFGRPARLPAGAAVLSRRSGAALVGCAMSLGEDGRWRLHIEEPVFPDSLSDEELQRRVTVLMESAIRKDPMRWFMFDPIWTGDACDRSGS